MKHTIGTVVYPAGLVLNAPLSGEAGLVALDQSSYRSNGTLGGSVVPTVNTLSNRQGLTFAATNWVDFGSSPNLDNLVVTGCTFSIWVYFKATDTGGTLFAKSDSLNTNGFSSAIDASSGNLTFFTYGAGGNYAYVITIPKYTWTHITLTIAKNGVARTLSYYVDGRFIISGSAGGSNPTDTGLPFRVGHQALGVNTFTNSFTGSLSKAHVYNRPLTAKEVYADYQLGLQPTYSLSRLIPFYTPLAVGQNRSFGFGSSTFGSLPFGSEEIIYTDTVLGVDSVTQATILAEPVISTFATLAIHNLTQNNTLATTSITPLTTLSLVSLTQAVELASVLLLGLGELSLNNLSQAATLTSPSLAAIASLTSNSLVQSRQFSPVTLANLGLATLNIRSYNFLTNTQLYDDSLQVNNLSQKITLALYSTILAGLTFPITNVQTVDLYYSTSYILSANTDGHSLSNYPFVDFKTSLDLVNLTLNVNTIAAAYTYAILGGIIDASFFSDYYNRLHLTPNPLELGQISDTLTTTENVWNAFLVPTTLTDITSTSLPDVSISLPLLVTLPYTFLPLQNVVASITASRSGVSTIKGNFNFITSLTCYPLYITGTRALFWPFNSISSFKETRSYLTDVIKCMSSEQRFSLREKPRLTLNYNYKFITNEEFSYAKILARNITNLPIAQALWTEAIKVSNLYSNQTVILVNVTDFEYSVGSIVVFWKSYKVWETATITAISSTSITILTGLMSDYTSCWVAPLFTGYAESGIKLQSEEKYRKSGSINTTCVNPFYQAISFFTTAFLGLPVLELPIVVSGGITNNYTREQETIENPTGIILKFDKETYTRETSTINLFSPNHKSLAKLRRGFDYLQGRYQSFWMPSSQRDMRALSNLNVGTGFVIIASGDFSIYSTQYIRITGTNNLGAVSECFTVASITSLDVDREKITFVLASTVIMTVSQIQILIRVRLDSDAINYDHQARGIAQLSVSVVEVLA